jgi:hypothetical protein
VPVALLTGESIGLRGHKNFSSNRWQDLEAMWQEEYQQNIQPQRLAPVLDQQFWADLDQWHAHQLTGESYDVVP